MDKKQVPEVKIYQNKTVCESRAFENTVLNDLSPKQIKLLMLLASQIGEDDTELKRYQISMKNAKIYFSGNPDKITKDFIRDYVEAGVQEINEKTDLHIDYKLNRKGTGRAYSSITFYIDKVKNVGSRLPDYEKPTPEAQEETQQDLMMQNLIDEYRNNYIDTDFLLEDEEYSPFD